MAFITLLIYSLLSLIAGSILIGASLNLLHLNISLIYLDRYLTSEYILADPSLRAIFFLGGMLIILFCLRNLQSMLIRSRRDKSITFDAPGGKVRITLFAIEDMIKKMLDTREEIAHIKPKVYAKKDMVEVIIKSNLASDVNLMEFTTQIQEDVQEKLRRLLGEEREITVRIEIRKMFMGRKKTSDEPEPEIPFRNYSE